MTATAPALRELPAEAIARTTCDGCGRPIVWALTVAGPNGRGGKLMPLDPLEDLAGNVAVTQPAARGQLYARSLFKDERVDRPGEYCGMPHFATCTRRGHHPTPPWALVELLDHARQRASGRRRGGRR